jgi:hypothetical protein
MITVTSLVHPSMIIKIRKGLYLAAMGKGHEMGGHGNRVYIQNRKGHNIMRIDWKGQGKFVVYGGADWGQTDVTEIVKEAVQRGCSADRVKPRALLVIESEVSQMQLEHSVTANPQAVTFVMKSPSLQARLARLVSLLALVLLVTIPTTPAFADKPPTAMESDCFKNPDLLICQMVANNSK